MVIIGYTHYWRGPRVITPEALEDIAKIIEASRVKIVGGYGDAGTEPVLTIDKIVLNGEGDDSHESLYIDPTEYGFGFTKTARKPYDKVVGAVLLRIREDSPQFNISSDGSWSEWRPARRLFEKVTGEEPVKGILRRV